MHTLKLHGVSFGEGLASHANAQTHSVSCKLRQSTTLEAGKRTGVKTEGKKKRRKLVMRVGEPIAERHNEFKSQGHQSPPTRLFFRVCSSVLQIDDGTHLDARSITHHSQESTIDRLTTPALPRVPLPQPDTQVPDQD